MSRSIALAVVVVGGLAALATRAEAGPSGDQLVVFPLQAVNVQEATARASTEVLASALRNQGFSIVDYEPPAPEPPPEAAPAPPPAAPPAAAPSPLPGAPAGAPGTPVLVDRAAPPPAPAGSADPLLAAAPAAPPAAPVAPELTAPRKGEIARELGCSGYVDGKLVRLGTKVRVSINRRDLDGKVVDSRESEAKTEDDLVGVLERISMAFAGDKTVDETLNLDNATMAETQRQAQRFRLEKNFGVVIGEMFGVMDTMDTATFIAFDGRLEITSLLITLNVGLGIAPADKWDDLWRDDSDLVNDSNEPGLQLMLNLDVAGYLSHTPISPYIGAGVGMFIGGRIHIKERKDFDHDGLDETKFYDSKVGFDLHPTFGVEFLRHAAIRVHVEVRYACDFAEGGRFGHGPTVFAGINF